MNVPGTFNEIHWNGIMHKKEMIDSHHRVSKMGLEHKYVSFGLTYAVLVKQP